MRFRSFLPIVVIALTAAGCGTIDGRYNSRHGGTAFNFAAPPKDHCSPQPPPAVAAEHQVVLRYFGAGGLYVRWKSTEILLGPFFTNQSLFRAAGVGHVVSDGERVRQKLTADGLDVSNVTAILAGHSHYDHIGDVPFVARELTPKATIYVNDSGVNALHAYDDLRERTRSYEHSGAFAVGDIVVTPVPSEHAPQFCRWQIRLCQYAPGAVEHSWTRSWDQHKLRDLRGGNTHAFVIDLKEGGATLFRIYYNDAAAGETYGIPRMNDGVPFDVAVLCLANWNHARRYPDALLKSIQPKHVLVAHFENFFSREDKRWTFPPLMTNGAANEFMKRLSTTMPSTGVPPTNDFCGVADDRWSIAVPGSWLTFATR